MEGSWWKDMYFQMCWKFVCECKLSDRKDRKVHFPLHLQTGVNCEVHLCLYYYCEFVFNMLIN